MGHDKHAWHLHQRGEAHGGAGVVGETHEGAAVGADTAVQRHAVHRGGHAVFTDPPVDVAPTTVVHIKHAQISGLCVIRTGQVSRAAHGFAIERVQHLKRLFAAGAGGQFRRVFRRLLFERLDRRAQLLGGVTGQRAVELFTLCARHGVETLFPGAAVVCAAFADLFPGGFHVGGDFERAGCPAIGGFGGGHLVRIGQRAVTFGRILRGVTKRDMRFASDHRGKMGFARLGQGGVDFIGVVAVDFNDVPVSSFETRDLIHFVGKRYRPVDGDVVVVPHHDQLAQLVAARKGNRLVADAFHQAAVTRDHIGEVVDDFLAVLRALDFLGHCKPDRVRDPLTQRAGGGFNRIGQEVFRVARGACAHLAEVLDLFEGELLVAGQVQQRIDQHGPVAGRQDKPVAVRPQRVGRVELQVLFKQDSGDIRHAHRHARVAGIGGGDSVQRQGANGGRFGPMGGMGFGEGVQIHGASFLIRGKRDCADQYQPPRKDQGPEGIARSRAFPPGQGIVLKGAVFRLWFR